MVPRRGAALWGGAKQGMPAIQCGLPQARLTCTVCSNVLLEPSCKFKNDDTQDNNASKLAGRVVCSKIMFIPCLVTL